MSTDYLDDLRICEIEREHLRITVMTLEARLAALTVERDTALAEMLKWSQDVVRLRNDLAQLHGQPFSRRDYRAMAARLDYAESRLTALTVYDETKEYYIRLSQHRAGEVLALQARLAALTAALVEARDFIRSGQHIPSPFIEMDERIDAALDAGGA